MGRIPIEELVSNKLVANSVKDTDTVVEKLDAVIAYLLFPQIKEFEVEKLVENHYFPTQNYKIMDEQEWDDYYMG